MQRGMAVRCLGSMKAGLVVCLAAGLGAAPLAARADALFDVAGHGPPGPASTVVETACEVDVDIHGGLATVEMRQHLANSGGGAMGAAYELVVPIGATLVGATLRDGSAPEAIALGVATGFQTMVARDGDVVGSDPLLLESIDSADDGRPRYRATLQPIDVARAVVLTTRWATAVTLDAGALRVTIPGRDANGALPACHGTVRAAGGPGATVAHLRAGKTVSTGSATFALDDADVPIAAELAFARPEPLVWTQREDLGDGFAAELVTVLAPPAHASGTLARRALFVIDGSRSMAMIGPAAVGKIVDAVAAAFAPGTQLDAILYDRTAARVLGTWQPADRAVAPILAAIGKHVGDNGSDLPGALRLAHAAIADGARDETAVVVITDGVLGQLPDTALVDALAATSSAVDVHAIVIDPGATHAPGKALLARPVSLYGGSYVEVGTDQLDAALAGVNEWVRPAWSDVELQGALDSVHGVIPSPLPAGGGGTRIFVTHGAAPAVALDAHGDTAVHALGKPAAAGGAIGAALGSLALAASEIDDFSLVGTAADHGPAARAREHAITTHPLADLDHALVVLAAGGKVAHDRRAMVAGGGPYTRIVAAADPVWPYAAPRAHAQPPPPSAIDRLTLERLFRDQLQPAAFVCYQRALGAAPKLAGTVYYTIDLGRGEVTRVALAGTGDVAFDACLVDAAYRMTPPLPDLRVNADDQTLVHYPLTFGLADHHPQVVLGDADSSSPLDIDAIEGGAAMPGPGKPIHVDTATPLGTMKPR
jgi:hypothetical protein